MSISFIFIIIVFQNVSFIYIKVCLLLDVGKSIELRYVGVLGSRVPLIYAIYIN